MLTTQIVLGHYGHFDDGIEILALNSLDVELNDKTRLYKTKVRTSFCHCVVNISRSPLPAANHGVRFRFFISSVSLANTPVFCS